MERIKRVVILAPTLLACFLCSCTSQPAGTGVVHGTWISSGGPAPVGGQPRTYPMSGVLNIQGNGSTITVNVGKSGVFQEVLKVGSYVVSGSCGQPAKFSIQSGKTVQVEINCSAA
jgi:hypothetical protein